LAIHFAGEPLPLTPDCLMLGTPLVRHGSFFGPLGGFPPWNVPAFDVRASCAMPVADFMLLALLLLLIAMAKTPDRGGNLARH
jgi:hypothetical protein